MNLILNAAFFVVVSGTQAPIGFTDQAAACIYMDRTRGATMFAWFKPSGLYASCYAVEDGCERAERDRQKVGVPMAEAKCVKREETKTVIEVVPR